jgi:hypothetical protein
MKSTANAAGQLYARLLEEDNMNHRTWIQTAVILIALVAVSSLLFGAGNADKRSPEPQRLVIKICNWDGVVPQKALDGFIMPKGKWADYQKRGWKVESYVVAPNASKQVANGLYAVLRK